MYRFGLSTLPYNVDDEHLASMGKQLVARGQVSFLVQSLLGAWSGSTRESNTYSTIVMTPSILCEALES